MNDLFSRLAHGAKFSSKKHGDAMKIFSQDSKKRDIMDYLDEDDHSSSSKSVSAKKSKSSKHIDNDEDITSSQPILDEQEVNAVRNRLHIKAHGDDIADVVPSFHDMKLSAAIRSVLLHNIEESKWKEPTPIQMQAIPCMLERRDVLAAAPTGSGKTAAYVIPTLSILHDTQRSSGIRAIFLAPTKELAEQIHRETLRLSYGKKMKISLLKKSTALSAIASQSMTTLAKIDIVVTTPMRLLSLIHAHVIDLTHVQVMILDEVDKLFEADSGRHDHDHHDDKDDEQADDKHDEEEEKPDIRSSFLSQVDEILHHCPSSVQCGLFSATLTPQVTELASTLLKRPIHINIGTMNAGASTILQKLMFVGREEGKLLAIRQLIQQGIKPPVIIFLQNKERAKELYKELVYDSINVDIIHSDRTSQQREDIITRFRIGEIWILICTDIIARGVDFKHIHMVINYDLPQSAISYIHRIGRTGRANKSGEAITFFTEDDIPKMRPIANVMKISGCEVPDWLLNIKMMNTKEKRMLRYQAPLRRSISTVKVSKHDHMPGKNNKNKKRKIDDIA